MKKAVVLLSGGVDSAVTLFMAMREYECTALVFDYGQKARGELISAQELARAAGVRISLIKIDLPRWGCALLDSEVEIPKGEDVSADGKVPETYVPARNMIFLSFAVSLAETEGARAVFIGAHQLDYSNYPDCRTEFFESFNNMIKVGTKAAAGSQPIRIITPVIDMTKKEIVEQGARLGVPFEYTWSCYDGEKTPCGECESCLFRVAAFKEAGVKDPALKNRD
ncbi:MAG: 7-cyano-7-deazaguanine synthase QueC [Candidatus Omnitrophica bacterium]|nr:7-cyano-7-deazaguanine synthase QueC [Candidatus Omnitrophota bacterium]